MKYTILLLLILFVGCSKDPVEMEVVLFERAGQWITNDDYSGFFFFNRKVYNGPAFNSYRSGEKREEGMLKMDIKQDHGLVWIKRGIKDMLESIRKEKPMANGPDIIKMEKRNMRVLMSMGFRLASGIIIMNKVKRPWRKFILTAMKNVKKSTLQIVAVYPIFVKNWGK